MNQRKTWSAIAAVLFVAAVAANAQYTLAERAFNIDGNIYDTPFGVIGDPPGANLAGFDTGTGLGTITYTIGTGNAGSHYIGAFFDHEISLAVNGSFNEIGAASGAPGAGLSWELGDPYNSTIYSDLGNKALTDSSLLTGAGINGGDDVSMAMAWNFLLTDTEKAIVTWELSDTAPAGFYLVQTDPDTHINVYFSTGVSVSNGGGPVPDGGSSLVMLGCGLTLLGGLSRRMKRQAGAAG